MFGEMIGVWLMTAFKNYDVQGDKSKKNIQTKQVVPSNLKTVNLVEIGPGTGTMMCDILRSLNGFTGNLKNIQINLVEASPNLRKA
jgi:SAM-dependent MidA family methyltransferase